MSIAVKWKNALLNKQIDVLVCFVLPEAKQKIDSELRDKNSHLYRIFYKEKNSIYEIFRNAKSLTIVLIKHKPLEQFGHGTDVYYYDKEKMELKFPLPNDKEQNLLDKGEIFKLFFFQEEGRWYTSYEFFGDD